MHACADRTTHPSRRARVGRHSACHRGVAVVRLRVEICVAYEWENMQENRFTRCLVLLRELTDGGMIRMVQTSDDGQKPRTSTTTSAEQSTVPPTLPSYGVFIFKSGLQTKKKGVCSARQGQCSDMRATLPSRMGAQRKFMRIAIHGRVCAPCVRAGAVRG